MRTVSEINKELEAISTKYLDNEYASYAAQALAWVVGDETSAFDLLNENFPVGVSVEKVA